MEICSQFFDCQDRQLAGSVKPAEARPKASVRKFLGICLAVDLDSDFVQIESSEVFCRSKAPLMPPNPVPTFSAFLKPAARRGVVTRLAGAPSAGFASRGVPGRNSPCNARTQTIVSKSPAAPRVWPNRPLLALIDGGFSPNIARMARDSIASLYGVPVPWALM